MTEFGNNSSNNDSSQVNAARMHTVSPPQYHEALRQYLKIHEAKLWHWFSSQKRRAESSEAVRLDLLKTTYRLDRESAAESELYRIAEHLASTMGISSSVTIYQAQQSVGLNASLAWLPDEVHIVLHGPVRETLDANEMRALLVHELAHHELLTISNNEFLVVEHILLAMIADQSAESSHERTWRSYRLWTELYCDRRAADIIGNCNACVSALVKMETGLKDVDATAYLTQADEVLGNSGSETISEGITHPEMFIRAKATQLWDNDPSTADVAVQRIVGGPKKLATLDLMQQSEVQLLTEQFIKAYLAPKWLQTNLMLGHAHRFLDTQGVIEKSSIAKHLVPNVTEQTPDDLTLQLAVSLGECDVQLRNVFCFVLLDFVTCDPDLEEAPLAAAFLFSDRCKLLEEFRSVVASELKLGKRASQKIESSAEQTVRNAEKEFTQ